MSRFNGRKCDNCGKEDREEVRDLEQTLNQTSTPEVQSTDRVVSPMRERPWMRVWWEGDRDFCPSCAVVADAALRFARRFRNAA